MKNEIEKEFENEDSLEEEFQMTTEEIEKAKTGAFNPFWKVSEQAANSPVVFRILSEKMRIKKLPSKFHKGELRPNLHLEIEHVETGAPYDLVSDEQPNSQTGNYSSLTTEMRRLFARHNGKSLKGLMISITRRPYEHETFGEKNGYSIRDVNPGE